jgi:hypothetical protein
MGLVHDNILCGLRHSRIRRGRMDVPQVEFVIETDLDLIFLDAAVAIVTKEI